MSMVSSYVELPLSIFRFVLHYPLTVQELEAFEPLKKQQVDIDTEPDGMCLTKLSISYFPAMQSDIAVSFNDM